MFMEWQFCFQITCLFHKTVGHADCIIQWLVKLNNWLYRSWHNFRYYIRISLEGWYTSREEHYYNIR